MNVTSHLERGGPDPYGPFTGANEFAYAPNPYSWIDPWGLAKKTYQTYTKTNPGPPPVVYSGRTSGTGTPEENVAKRDCNHHRQGEGFGPAVLDKSSSKKDAIRGREQQLIDKNRKNGTAADQINGISPKNKKKQKYMDAANDPSNFS